MGWSNGQGMGPTANDVLAAIHQKGIQLWVDGPQLRYKAPGGVSIDDEVRALQQRKAEIIAILTAKRSEAPHELRSYVQSSFPLTYVQQAYWNLHRLVERPATRGIAGAIRLIGELNAGVLERCLNVIMDRQAALRTHIVVSDGVPMQQIAEAVERELQLVNLFDKQYATAGFLTTSSFSPSGTFIPNPDNRPHENAVAPAAPRAIWVGMRVRWE